MIDIVEFSNFLIKHKITANQFYLLYITMTKRYELMYQYLQALKDGNKEMYAISGGIPSYEIENLEERGYLTNLDPKGNKFLDMFIANDKFVKHFNNTTNFEEANEFWAEYPENIFIDGKKVPCRNIPKDRFISEYSNLIKNRKDVHLKAMAKLKYDKAKQIQFSGIQKYIDRKPWETFEEPTITPNSDLI